MRRSRRNSASNTDATGAPAQKQALSRTGTSRTISKRQRSGKGGHAIRDVCGAYGLSSIASQIERKSVPRSTTLRSRTRSRTAGSRRRPASAGVRGGARDPSALLKPLRLQSKATLPPADAAGVISTARSAPAVPEHAEVGGAVVKLTPKLDTSKANAVEMDNVGAEEVATSGRVTFRGARSTSQSPGQRSDAARHGGLTGRSRRRPASAVIGSTKKPVRPPRPASAQPRVKASQQASKPVWVDDVEDWLGIPKGITGEAAVCDIRQHNAALQSLAKATPQPGDTDNLPMPPVPGSSDATVIDTSWQLRFELADDEAQEQWFSQALSRLEMLWVELDVPHSDRETFRKCYTFSKCTLETATAVATHLNLLLRHERARTAVLTHIRLREQALESLQTELKDFLRSADYHATTVPQGRKQRVRKALLAVVRQGAMCVEAICQWRQTLWRPYAFKHRGVNYLLKMQTDADFVFTADGARMLSVLRIASEEAALMSFPVALLANKRKEDLPPAVASMFGRFPSMRRKVATAAKEIAAEANRALTVQLESQQLLARGVYIPYLRWSPPSRVTQGVTAAGAPTAAAEVPKPKPRQKKKSRPKRTVLRETASTRAKRWDAPPDRADRRAGVMDNFRTLQ